MKLSIAQLSVAALTSLILITGCKKDSTSNSNDESTTKAQEQNRVSDDMDAVATEMNLAMESTASFSGRTTQTNTICGATVVFDSTLTQKTLTITYDGQDCFGTHTRKGKVILYMNAGRRWRDKGATIIAEFRHLVITRLSDNKLIVLNGTQTMTNVSGGLLYSLPTGVSITHTITSDQMAVSFPDSTHSIWQIARQRVFTYDAGAVMTVTGMHTEGNTTGIAEWGTNRYGQNFTTAISSPLIVKQSCNFRLTAGQVSYQGFLTGTATFGLNKEGNPTTCPGTGSYYMKLDWSLAGNTLHSAILPY